MLWLVVVVVVVVVGEGPPGVANKAVRRCLALFHAECVVAGDIATVCEMRITWLPKAAGVLCCYDGSSSSHPYHAFLPFTFPPVYVAVFTYSSVEGVILLITKQQLDGSPSISYVPTARSVGGREPTPGQRWEEGATGATRAQGHEEGKGGE